MTSLNIQQGSNVEIVTATILKKLYEIATSNSMQSCTLEGNLQTIYCWKKIFNYFMGSENNTRRFPDLNINVTSDYLIDFADAEVERILKNQIGHTTSLGVTQTEVQN